MRRKPTALIGAPRSLMNTYRPGSCSRSRRRRERSSAPVRGWTEGRPLGAGDMKASVGRWCEAEEMSFIQCEREDANLIITRNSFEPKYGSCDILSVRKSKRVKRAWIIRLALHWGRCLRRCQAHSHNFPLYQKGRLSLRLSKSMMAACRESAPIRLGGDIVGHFSQRFR
jgi:hypothetical protein